MRNPDRIYPMMCHIAEVWQKEVPDWRFGQLIINIISACGDPFYWEDDKFLEMFDKYFKGEI